MIGAALSRDCGRERNHRCKRDQVIYERLSSTGSQMFRDFKTHGQIKRSVKSNGYLKIHGLKIGSWNFQLLWVDIIAIYGHQVGYTAG